MKSKFSMYIYPGSFDVDWKRFLDMASLQTKKSYWVLINELTEFISMFIYIYIDIVNSINRGRVWYSTLKLKLTVE